MAGISSLFNIITDNKKYLILFALIPLLYFPCYISDDFVRQMAKEDGVFENLGALFFLLTAIVFFALAFRPGLYKFKSENRTRERMFLILLGILFFFAFGEEISWGQRIFNYETPESIKEINRQREFNLHNIGIFHGRTVEGNEKTGLMKLFTMHRLFYMAFFTYLFIVPLLYQLNTRFKAFINRIRLPVPSIIFGLLFCFNWLYGNALRATYTQLDGHGIVEIKETIFALILLVLAFSWIKAKNIG